MDEENDNNQEEPNEESSEQPINYISDQKLRKLKNLKMFHGWSDEAIREYFKDRDPKTPKPPERPFSDDDPEVTADMEYSKAEYDKKYKGYMTRYRKEYDADMNDANDVQALESLVRLVIQAEVVDENIRAVQRNKNFDSRTLKNMGDFQRSVQMSITELQDRLGISRKSRKDRQADDFPAYIKQIRQKAMDFWQRQTVPVKCEKCQIELARFWLNFPDNTETANFQITCEKCREKVVYSL
jgi:hypothetical protein